MISLCSFMFAVVLIYSLFNQRCSAEIMLEVTSPVLPERPGLFYDKDKHTIRQVGNENFVKQCIKMDAADGPEVTNYTHQGMFMHAVSVFWVNFNETTAAPPQVSVSFDIWNITEDYDFGEINEYEIQGKKVWDYGPEVFLHEDKITLIKNTSLTVKKNFNYSEYESNRREIAIKILERKDNKEWNFIEDVDNVKFDDAENIKLKNIRQETLANQLESLKMSTDHITHAPETHASAHQTLETKADVDHATQNPDHLSTSFNPTLEAKVNVEHGTQIPETNTSAHPTLETKADADTIQAPKTQTIAQKTLETRDDTQQTKTNAQQTQYTQSPTKQTQEKQDRVQTRKLLQVGDRAVEDGNNVAETDHWVLNSQKGSERIEDRRLDEQAAESDDWKLDTRDVWSWEHKTETEDDKDISSDRKGWEPELQERKEKAKDWEMKDREDSMDSITVKTETSAKEEIQVNSHDKQARSTETHTGSSKMLSKTQGTGKSNPEIKASLSKIQIDTSNSPAYTEEGQTRPQKAKADILTNTPQPQALKSTVEEQNIPSYASINTENKPTATTGTPNSGEKASGSTSEASISILDASSNTAEGPTATTGTSNSGEKAPVKSSDSTSEASISTLQASTNTAERPTTTTGTSNSGEKAPVKSSDSTSGASTSTLNEKKSTPEISKSSDMMIVVYPSFWDPRFENTGNSGSRFERDPRKFEEMLKNQPGPVRDENCYYVDTRADASVSV